MGQQQTIPEPVANDNEDVSWALSAASSMWRRGDGPEALKWLRRAAGAAADVDADVRAVQIAKAAADVATRIDPPPSARVPRPPRRLKLATPPEARPPEARPVSPMPSLPAVRVALVPVPEDGDVRVVFLGPGAVAPPGIATAMLVPTSPEDAERLARLHADCSARID